MCFTLLHSQEHHIRLHQIQAFQFWPFKPFLFLSACVSQRLVRSVKCPVKVQMQLRFGSVTWSTRQKEIHKRANTWDKLLLKRFISKIITHSHTFFFFFCYEFIPFLLVQCNIVYSENPCAWLSVHPMFFTHCYSATHSPGSKHAEAPTGHFISIQGTGLNSFTL